MLYKINNAINIKQREEGEVQISVNQAIRVVSQRHYKGEGGDQISSLVALHRVVHMLLFMTLNGIEVYSNPLSQKYRGALSHIGYNYFFS